LIPIAYAARTAASASIADDGDAMAHELDELQVVGVSLDPRRDASYRRRADAVDPMRALLLTGRPGIGKTTVIRRVAEALAGERIAGFYTEEERRRGERTGFRIVTLDGRSRPMAGIDIRSRERVGKYGVDVAAIDAVAETALVPEGAEIFLVDEIGRMECASRSFVDAMRRLLAADRVVVASVALKGDGLIAEVKRLPGIVLWEVTAQNRDRLPGEVIGWVCDRLPRAAQRR
jgi:nucleoside-triphosphatase